MIRRRFAPSPTGSLHIGGVRTAFYAWLFARHHQGKFLLRIEDTDTLRSTPESVDSITRGLSWVGLVPDEPAIFQSNRNDHYAKALDKLERSGRAYRCDCSVERLASLREGLIKKGLKPRYDGHCRNRDVPKVEGGFVIRFMNPLDGTVQVNDLVKGLISFENSELDDLIIQRSNGTPTYNFCVSVDDTAMQITHVIRGDDHLNNTPRQINIIEALGESIPVYAHLPMIHGEDGHKLSKRHGAVSVLDFKEKGYTPEVLLNYIARLGWSHGDQELFSIDELVTYFELHKVSPSPSIFDYKKLDWVSQQHMLKMSEEELATHFIDAYKGTIEESDRHRVLMYVNNYKERAKNFKELAEKCLPYFQEPLVSDPEQQAKFLTRDAKPVLESLIDILSSIQSWEPDSILLSIKAATVQLNVKMGAIAQPLRVALVGTSSSPGIGETLSLVGKGKTIKRMHHAIDYIVNLDNNVT